MATRTIAPGGGNWNSTGTWVEGAVPVNGDLVVGAATSGNLTINVNPNFQYVMDMTNYAATMSIATGTFAMPSNISTPLLTISTFSSAMTIAYSSPANICVRTNGTANTWSFLGNGPFGEFPIMSLSQVNQALTINGVLRANQLSRTNARTILNRGASGGTMSINRYVAFAGGAALMDGSCPIVFDRSSGEFTNSTNSFGGYITNPIVINTTGTFSITPTATYNYGFIGVRSNGSLTYIQGNISNTNKNIWIGNQLDVTSNLSGVTATLDLAGSGTWSSVHISDSLQGTYNANMANTIQLNSDLYFNQLRIQNSNGNGLFLGGAVAYRIITRFSGSGRLKGGYLTGQAIFNSWGFQTNTIPNSNGVAWFVPRIQLANGLPTNDFKGIRLYGPPNGDTGGGSPSYCLISSTTGGTKAYINVEEPTSFGVQYLDIDASAGTEIENYFGVVTNSVNITNTNALPSGGGGETSVTFVN